MTNNEVPARASERGPSPVAGLDPPPGIYDYDDLDEMSLGVLGAYADVRQLLLSGVQDPAVAAYIAGVVDGLARQLIENSRDDDEEDGEPQ